MPQSLLCGPPLTAYTDTSTENKLNAIRLTRRLEGHSQVLNAGKSAPWDVEWKIWNDVGCWSSEPSQVVPRRNLRCLPSQVTTSTFSNVVNTHIRRLLAQQSVFNNFTISFFASSSFGLLEDGTTDGGTCFSPSFHNLALAHVLACLNSSNSGSALPSLHLSCNVPYP